MRELHFSREEYLSVFPGNCEAELSCSEQEVSHPSHAVPPEEEELSSALKAVTEADFTLAVYSTEMLLLIIPFLKCLLRYLVFTQKQDSSVLLYA